MLLVANQLKIKVLAVVVALALVMPMVMMPVGAAQAQENCPWAGIEYLDMEIKVIDGQPVLIYETETGYEEIPFSLSELGDAYADGQKMPLQTQGNSILVPTEEGPVAVPIEDFCVVMIDGEMMLLAEENPFWKIPIAIAIAALKKAGVAVTTTTLQIAGMLILTGNKVNAWTVERAIKAKPIIDRTLAGAIGFVSGTVSGDAFIDWLTGVCIMPGCKNRSIGGKWTLDPRKMVCACLRCP